MPAGPLTGAAAAPTPAPLVIVDRDGVINHESAAFIRTPDEWRPLPGSIEAIARLTRAGFRVYVATNQSGLARGLITPAALASIHRRLEAAVAAAGGELAGIFVCPHGPDAGCDCRKPAPGLLRQIAAASGAALAGVPCVGDSERDLAAAEAVGARPLLVLTGNGASTAAARALPVETCADLAAVADRLIAEKGSRS